MMQLIFAIKTMYYAETNNDKNEARHRYKGYL